MQIYADFLSFFFLPNLSATSAQGLLIYNHFNRPCNEVEPMFMGL